MSYTLFRCLCPEIGNQCLAQQLLGHPFIFPNVMQHGLSNNITLDNLDAEKDHGRNQNGRDDGDEYPDLMPISFGYTARNSRVRNEFEVLQMLVADAEECLLQVSIKVTYYYIYLSNKQ